MKYLILLTMLMTGLVTQAQPLFVSSSAMKKFSRAIRDEAEKDISFRDKLDILLRGSDTALDFNKAVRGAEKDSMAFFSLIDATFLINSSPDSYADWLQSLGVSGKDVPALADFALYRFTNRGKPNPKAPPDFPLGSGSLCLHTGMGMISYNWKGTAGSPSRLTITGIHMDIL